MLLGIDHLVIAVNDPDVAVSDLAAHLGLEAGGGGAHEAWGTRNRLLWLGDTFIELLGVVDEDRASTSWLGAPALAARAAWPALIGWAIASDDLETDLSALRGAGAQLEPPIPGERRRADGKVVRWSISLPPRIALERPFLIEHLATSAEWMPKDRATRATRPGRLVGIDLPVSGIDGVAGTLTSIGPHRVSTTTPGRRPIIHVTAPRPSGRAALLGCDWIVA